MTTTNSNNNNNNSSGANNTNDNNNINNGTVGFGNFGLGKLGWMSSLGDQLNQIKDVMTSENGGYDQEEDDEEDEVFVLRAESLKYKQDITQLEQRILELEEREVNISKEYSLILKEKNNEIIELNNVNNNLKSSLISPKSISNNNNNGDNNGINDDIKSKSKQQQKQQQNHDNESLGIPLEHDDYNENGIQQQNNNNNNNDNNNNSNSNEQFLNEQLEKNKQDFQNQISEIQETNQEKLNQLTLKIEQLDSQLSDANDEKLKLENEKLQNKILNENLKNENQSLLLNIKELNEKIIKTTTTTTDESLNKNINNNNITSTTNNDEQQQQINTLKEQVKKSTKELARLRQHLIDMEDQHTTIDLENEEKILKLETGLKKSMEQNSNSVLINEQINKINKELIEKDEQFRQSQQQLYNLNCVLEQFQADQEVTIQTETIHLEQKLQQLSLEIDHLKKDKLEHIQLQKKYQDSKDQIQLLYQDIQSKTFDFIKLKEDIEPLKAAFDRTILRLGDMCLQEQESVDKRVVSKLFLNYFRGNKKTEILELIAKILNFSDSEKISIGLTGKKNQWSLLPPFFGNKDVDGTTDNGEKPLAEMWIEFLLKESSGDNLNSPPLLNTLNDNNNSNSSSLSNPTPFSTPVKLQPPLPSQQQQPTQFATTTSTTPFTTPVKQPINNNYFNNSVTPNGKKSTVIFDGDVDTPFK